MVHFEPNASRTANANIALPLNPEPLTPLVRLHVSVLSCSGIVDAKAALW